MIAPLVHRDAAAAQGVEGRDGHRPQVLGGLAGVADGQTDAAPDGDLLAVDGDRVRREGGQQPFGGRDGLLLVLDPVQQHHELVAAHAGLSPPTRAGTPLSRGRPPSRCP